MQNDFYNTTFAFMIGLTFTKVHTMTLNGIHILAWHIFSLSTEHGLLSDIGVLCLEFCLTLKILCNIKQVVCKVAEKVKTPFFRLQ